MKRIGLLSDTHGYLDPKINKYFSEVDEIWHIGDVGTTDVITQLQKIKPTIGVYGNIDGQDIRKIFPKEQFFYCEDVSVYMIHIGGYPKRYAKGIKEQIIQYKPKLFISGHSHILKVCYDKELNLLHINPGACGKQGFHQVKTLIRFTIDEANIKDLEVIELGKK